MRPELRHVTSGPFVLANHDQFDHVDLCIVTPTSCYMHSMTCSLMPSWESLSCSSTHAAFCPSV